MTLEILPGLVNLCRELGPELDGPKAEDDSQRTAFLLALTGQESSWGLRWMAGRYEPRYARGGFYYRSSKIQRMLVNRYEDLAACSWGPTQILPVVAWEVGFRGDPWELADPRCDLTWTVKRFNEKCLRRTVKVGQAFKQEWRDGIGFPLMFAFWNGGPSTLRGVWRAEVKDYVTAQMGNLDTARGVLSGGVNGRCPT